MRKAFTLIELLIVVAIIAILAAIAVPNFLEAQTRAKVSRTYADMRTVAYAIRAYEVDNNVYPHYDLKNYTMFGWFLKTDQPLYNYPTMGRLLTSPIAYITDIPWDPFNSKVAERQGSGMRQVSIMFHCVKRDRTGGWGIVPYVGQPFHWILESWGPDILRWDGAHYNAYDPTNGTISYGDIWYLDTMGFSGGGL